MITICHPVDDKELLFIRMELEAEEIPYFVVGENYGSLFPGMQVPWLNERSVRVPVSLVAEGLEVIRRVRDYYEPTFVNLRKRSKLRMLFEGLILGWVIPAGKKRPSNSVLKQDAPDRRAD